MTVHIVYHFNAVFANSKAEMKYYMKAISNTSYHIRVLPILGGGNPYERVINVVSAAFVANAVRNTREGAWLQ